MSTYPVLQDGALDLINCNTVALVVVGTIRKPVYPKRHLEREGGPAAVGKKAPCGELKRRERVRSLGEDLSQYYQLAGGQGEWRWQLLSEGRHGRDHSTP